MIDSKNLDCPKYLTVSYVYRICFRYEYTRIIYVICPNQCVCLSVLMLSPSLGWPIFFVYISYAAGSLSESKLICLPVRARVWVCVRLNIKRHCQDYESNVFRIFFFKWKQRTTRRERNLKSNSVNNRVEIHI